MQRNDEDFGRERSPCGDIIEIRCRTISRQRVQAQIRDPATNKQWNLGQLASSTILSMATQQAEGGVPFSVAHDMRQFRLFELPLEIVELIDAPNPPT